MKKTIFKDSFNVELHSKFTEKLMSKKSRKSKSSEKVNLERPRPLVQGQNQKSISGAIVADEEREKGNSESRIDQNKWMGLLFLLLLIIGAMLYSRTSKYEFTLDDVIVYSENQFVQKGWSGINDILSNETFTGYFKDQKNLLSGARYRPLSLVTFAAEVGLWGENAGRAHLINWILYCINSFMVGWVILLLLKRRLDAKLLLTFASAASILFLLYPLHVEAVANIKGRDEILCLSFSLLSLWSYLKWNDTAHLKWLVLGMLATFLAFLAKESAIFLPILIPITILIFRPKYSGSNLFKSFISILFIALIYIIIRFKAVGYLLSSGTGLEDQDIMNNPYVGLTFSERLPNVMAILWKYIQLAIVPYPLTHDYYPWQIPLQQWSSPMALCGLMFFLVFIGALIWTWRKSPIYFYPLLWIGLSVMLISNLVINVGTILNERFLYYASFGIIFLFCLLLKYLWQKLKAGKYISSALFIGMTIFYFVVSYQRIPAWSNNFTLNSTGIKVSQNSSRANLFMGVSYFNKYQTLKDDSKWKMLDSASYFINRAVKIEPRFSSAASMSTGVAAEQYSRDNNLDTLLSNFRIAMERFPNLTFVAEYNKFLAGRGMSEAITKFYVDLYRNEIKKGNKDQARIYLQKGLAILPNNSILLQELNTLQ